MLDRHLDRHVVLERDEIAGETGLQGELGQTLAALGLLDLAGTGEQRVEVAVLVDELGGGLDADARHARHVVGGVAGQRLHVDDLVGRHAEFLAHLVGPDGLVLHGVEHDEAGLDQLHEVLVGGDDGHVAAGSQHALGVGGDEVVGLVAALLEAGDVEGLDGLADERELGNELLGRRRAVRLVVLVDLVAERLLAVVEYDGEVRGPARPPGVLQQLPQHGAKAVHGADGQAVGGARQGRQRMEGAEDVARAVDEVDVAALDDGNRLARRHRAGGGRLGSFLRFFRLGLCGLCGHGGAL